MVYAILAALLFLSVLFLLGLKLRAPETKFLLTGRRMLIELAEKVNSRLPVRALLADIVAA